MTGRYLNPYSQHEDDAGLPLSNGSLEFFDNRTTTRATIFTDNTEMVPQTNPYTLDAAGRVVGDVYYTGLKTVAVMNELGAVIRTINDVTVISNTAVLQQEIDNLSSQIIKNFVNVDAMIADANVAIGDFVYTNYYTNPEDGGNNRYMVRALTTDPADAGSLIKSVANPSVEFVGLFPFGQYNISQWGPSNMQAALNYMNTIGGGILYGTPGQTYTQTNSLTIFDDTYVNLSDATIQLNLTGTGGFDYGCRLSNRSWIVNGAINVTSTGNVGSQGGIHACVNIGPLDGDGGTVATPSPFLEVNGWGIQNLTLATDRAAKDAVSIKAGVNNGYVGYITINDNSNMSGIHADWGLVGEITSSNVPLSRTNFDAGTAYTLHPNNITIEHVRAGNLTNSGAFLVRLSGVYNMHVRDCSIEQIVGTGGTTAAIFHTAGDLGFEFALAEVKKFAHMGIVIERMEIKNTTVANGLFCDCFADNVALSVINDGYVPLLPPIARTDIILKDIQTKSQSGAGANQGMRIQRMIGGTLDNSVIKFHTVGLLLEEDLQSFTVNNCIIESNREQGIKAGHPSRFVRYLTVSNCKVRLNGTDAGAGTIAGILFDGVADGVIEGNYVGDTISETTQDRGIEILTLSSDIAIRGNHVEDVSSVSQAYRIGTATSYGILKEFSRNTWNTTKITNAYFGVNIRPYSFSMDFNGNIISRSWGVRLQLNADQTPTAGTWQAGDTIYYDDGPSISGFYGTVCDVSGSPGTWVKISLLPPP